MVVDVFDLLENLVGKGYKMQVTSIFSFSNNVSKNILLCMVKGSKLKAWKVNQK